MKKSTKELWLLWKKSVGWDEKTIKRKLFAAWFSLSFPLVAILGGSWFAILGLINLVMAAYFTVKYVPVSE